MVDVMIDFLSHNLPSPPSHFIDDDAELKIIDFGLSRFDDHEVLM